MLTRSRDQITLSIEDVKYLLQSDAQAADELFANRARPTKVARTTMRPIFFLLRVLRSTSKSSLREMIANAHRVEWQRLVQRYATSLGLLMTPTEIQAMHDPSAHARTKPERSPNEKRGLRRRTVV